jgi:hypothetical protein
MHYYNVIVTHGHRPNESKKYLLTGEQIKSLYPWMAALVVEPFYLDYTTDLIRYKVEPAGEVAAPAPLENNERYSASVCSSDAGLNNQRVVSQQKNDTPL